MDCRHFGECGACNLYDMGYEGGLEYKKKSIEELLSYRDIAVFSSPQHNYRSRAEFRIWHEGDECFYAMTNSEKNGVVKISECQMVSPLIESVMWRLINSIKSSQILKNRLFGVEFLGSTKSDLLVTFLYHKKLDEAWIKEAKELEEKYQISIIGRSKGQKIVLSKDYIDEILTIDDVAFCYRQYDGGFTQPNPKVNEKMIGWAKEMAKKVSGGDLLELYCGLGNFTLPLAAEFSKVLATEVSKKSISNAKENCTINDTQNIEFIRLSSEEMSEAFSKKRLFNRLRDVDLDSYSFSCVLVDPPRAGLDSDTIELIAKIPNIIYISCNPQTLARDLEILKQTHSVENVAIFDQFPYTKHIESGVFLKKK